MKPVCSPIQITFRDLSPSLAVATRVRAEVARLSSAYAPILYCRVFIAAPRRRHRPAGCALRIDLGLPGIDVVVWHEPKDGSVVSTGVGGLRETFVGARQSVCAAIRDGFIEVRNRLEAQDTQRRRAAKVHLPADAPLPV